MAFVGVALIIFGIIEEFEAINTASVVGLWILGILFLIPGGYNTIQVIRAYCANRDGERARLLNTI